MRHSFVYLLYHTLNNMKSFLLFLFGWIMDDCQCVWTRAELHLYCIMCCVVLCCVVYVFVHYGSAPFSRPFRRRLSANTQRCRRVGFVTHSLSKCWCVRYHRANSNLSGFSRNRTWQQQKKTEIMIFIIGFIEMINEDSGVQGTVCCVLHSTQCRTCHTRRSVSLWLLLIRFVTPLCVNRLDRWAVDHFCSVFHNPFCHSLRRLHFRIMKMTDDVSDGTHSHHLTHVINAMNEHLSRIHSRPGHSGLNEKRPSKAVWMTVSL